MEVAQELIRVQLVGFKSTPAVHHQVSAKSETGRKFPVPVQPVAVIKRVDGGNILPLGIRPIEVPPQPEKQLVFPEVQTQGFLYGRLVYNIAYAALIVQAEVIHIVAICPVCKIGKIEPSFFVNR